MQRYIKDFKGFSTNESYDQGGSYESQELGLQLDGVSLWAVSVDGDIVHLSTDEDRAMEELAVLTNQIDRGNYVSPYGTWPKGHNVGVQRRPAEPGTDAQDRILVTELPAREVVDSIAEALLSYHDPLRTVPRPDLISRRVSDIDDESRDRRNEALSRAAKRWDLPTKLKSTVVEAIKRAAFDNAWEKMRNVDNRLNSEARRVERRFHDHYNREKP